MDRYWRSSASTDAPAVPDSNAGGYPADGNAAIGIDGTVPGAWWYHAITEELRNAIIKLGSVPDWTKTDQLGAAVTSAISNASSSFAAPGGSALIGFIQHGTNAIARTAQDKMRDALSTHDFPTVQDAINEAVASGRTLVIEAGTAIPQLTINGRIDIVARGTVTCAYDGTNGAWIHIPAGADESSLIFDTIDFISHGTMGVLLDASRCTVYVRLAKNQVAQAYAIANRQGVVVSQAADNVIDVGAWNFSEGATQGANAVPRIVTTESNSTRNVVRVRAYQTHTVWIDSGTNNTAEYLIVDSCTDNAIYNLTPSVGMKCLFMQYTNGKDEPFVLEGTRPWIGKAVYDGWGFPGVQNCTGAVVDEIVVLPPPDGAPSEPVLRSRDGNTQADISIGRVTAWLNVSDITQYAMGAFLQLYVGNVDISIKESDIHLTWLAASATPYLVVHRNGAVAEFDRIRVRLNDSAAQAQPMYWQYPGTARLVIRSLDLDARDYPWLKFSNVTSANGVLPRGQELLGDVIQNPSLSYPVARTFTGTAAPTSGNWNRGDYVQNKFPNVGTPTGWACIASGSPGTWLVAGFAGGQLNADWNATSGVTQILNKPPLATAIVNLSGGASVVLDLTPIAQGAPEILFNLSIADGVTTAVSFANPPITGTLAQFVLQVTNGAGSAITWPYNIKWPQGIAPSLSGVAGKLDTFVIFTQDGGASYCGFVSGMNQ